MDTQILNLNEPYEYIHCNGEVGKHIATLIVYENTKSDGGSYKLERNLQTMLCQEWFDKVCVDRRKYTKQWRELVIAKLMGSRHKKEIAKKWEERSQRLQIKGHVIGAFVKAGVLKGSKLAVARTFYNIEDDTPEVKTLAKYMGDLNRVYYADWIIEYIKKDSLIEKE